MESGDLQLLQFRLESLLAIVSQQNDVISGMERELACVIETKNNLSEECHRLAQSLQSSNQTINKQALIIRKCRDDHKRSMIVQGAQLTLLENLRSAQHLTSETLPNDTLSSVEEHEQSFRRVATEMEKSYADLRSKYLEVVTENISLKQKGGKFKKLK